MGSIYNEIQGVNLPRNAGVRLRGISNLEHIKLPINPKSISSITFGFESSLEDRSEIIKLVSENDSLQHVIFYLQKFETKDFSYEEIKQVEIQ